MLWRASQTSCNGSSLSDTRRAGGAEPTGASQALPAGTVSIYSTILRILCMDLDRRPGAHRYINGERIRLRRTYRTTCRPCLPNPLLPGVYYLLSLPIYSLILFIYHTALDRQASEVPRYLVCTEKYPAGGAAPAFLPPSSFSRDTPVESVIFSAFV